MSDNESFPTANLVPRPPLLRFSKLWWLTGLCLLIAVGLVWSSMKPAGHPITIRFARGHGLKVGDVIRHCGIDIGHVEGIRLDEDLDGIVVEAVLDHDASSIARGGTRFWIARPRVSVGQIRDLDTALGAKYIGVLPAYESAEKGEQREPKDVFDGLAMAPADEDGAESGLEIVLRGTQRKGIEPGAPLTYRGIKVGRVLSVGLSPNAMHVDARVRVDQQYRQLVRAESKFWVTSGVELDLGVTGVKVLAESIETITRGGVAFITPRIKSESAGVSDDVVFLLEKVPDEDVIESAQPIQWFGGGATNQASISTFQVQTEWQTSFLGVTRSKSQEASGWVITEQGKSPAQAIALFPLDIGTSPDDAVEGSFKIKFRLGNKVVSIDPESVKPSPSFGAFVAEAPYPQEIPLPGGVAVLPQRLRSPMGPEDVFVIRGVRGKPIATTESGAGHNRSMQMFGRQVLSRSSDGWEVIGTPMTRRIWHGAAVMSAKDERLVGMLVVDDSAVKIIPFSKKLPSFQ